MIIGAPPCPKCKESMVLVTIDVTGFGQRKHYALNWHCEGAADWVDDHFPEVIAVGDE